MKEKNKVFLVPGAILVILGVAFLVLGYMFGIGTGLAVPVGIVAALLGAVFTGIAVL